jgi:hypothetical protein
VFQEFTVGNSATVPAMPNKMVVKLSNPESAIEGWNKLLLEE